MRACGKRWSGFAWTMLVGLAWAGPACAGEPNWRAIDAQRIELTGSDGTRQTLRVGERSGAWTLMAILPGPTPRVVLEDFSRRDGELRVIAADGRAVSFGKTAESTEDRTPGVYGGHDEKEVRASATDLLGDAILDAPGDPQYDAVAAVFPPLRRIRLGTYDFVGTPGNQDKVNFQYGGRSPNFDPAVLQPSLVEVRKAGKVWNGLVGGALPAVRFVYPESDDAWTEMVAFAPFRTVQGNDRIQPVWYRVSRIEKGVLK